MRLALMKTTGRANVRQCQLQNTHKYYTSFSRVKGAFIRVAAWLSVCWAVTI